MIETNKTSTDVQTFFCSYNLDWQTKDLGNELESVQIICIAAA